MRYLPRTLAILVLFAGGAFALDSSTTSVTARGQMVEPDGTSGKTEASPASAPGPAGGNEPMQPAMSPMVDPDGRGPSVVMAMSPMIDPDGRSVSSMPC